MVVTLKLRPRHNQTPAYRKRIRLLMPKQTRIDAPHLCTQTHISTVKPHNAKSPVNRLGFLNIFHTLRYVDSRE